MKRFLCVLVATIVIGCNATALQRASKVLDTLCEIRPQLDWLQLAQQYVDKGDVPAAVAALKSHLNEYGRDDVVSSLLFTLEEHLRYTQGANGLENAPGLVID